MKSEVQLATDRPRSENWVYKGHELSARFRYKGQDVVPFSVVVILVNSELEKAKLFDLSADTYEAALAETKELGNIWVDFGFPGDGEFKLMPEGI